MYIARRSFSRVCCSSFDAVVAGMFRVPRGRLRRCRFTIVHFSWMYGCNAPRYVCAGLCEDIFNDPISLFGNVRIKKSEKIFYFSHVLKINVRFELNNNNYYLLVIEIVIKNNWVRQKSI